MTLNKHQIFGCDDMRYSTLDVPEWGGEIRLKTMSFAEQSDYEKLKESKDSAGLIVGMVVRCAVDEHGKRLFEESDLEELQKKNTQVLVKIFHAALELNSLHEDELKSKAKK